MKNYLYSTLGIAILIFGLSSAAQGTLVGDTVTIQHFFPTINNLYNPLGDTTVTEGDDDTARYSFLWFDVYTVNVEAQQILIDFSTIAVWASGDATFNGLVVGDLDDDSGNALSHATFSTNLAGWDDSRLLLGDDYIGFNFAGLSVTPNTYIDTNLFFPIEAREDRLDQDISDPQLAVPEPATLFLFGSGLLGFGFQARRKIFL